MTPFRLLIFSVVVGVLALLVPKLAPQLIADASTGTAAPSASVAVPPSPRARQVALNADARGHFVTDVEMNGRRVSVMVDTGATVVALNAETARRLGISPAGSDYTAAINTANGTVRVAPVRLTEIRLGDIAVRDVEAVVVPDESLSTNLLGMSFLGRLARFEIEGQQLLLAE